MKKKLLLILSIIFIVLLCSISFYGCGEKKSVKVSFNANGGTFITGETIKEIETEKSTIISQIDVEVERLGYTFLGWDYDFTTPVSNDIEIKAKWQAKTDTPYKVEYYLQNIVRYTCNFRFAYDII